jgi:hypothetical protein
MGTVYKETFTKPLPAGARIIARKGLQLTPDPDAKPPEPTPAKLARPKTEGWLTTWPTGARVLL